MRINISVIIFFILVFSMMLMISTASQSKSIPIALFHGIGDACHFQPVIDIVNFLKEKLDTDVKCIEIGNGFVSSWFMRFENQAQVACDKIKADNIFNGRFSVFGISQGSLIGRFIIEKCDITGQVVNYVSFDGPQMGIGSLPKITCPVICPVINRLVGKIIYNKYFQDNLGPAGYYKDKYEYEEFLQYSSFLADLNNERHEKNLNYKIRFSKLEKVLLIKNKQDSVITPRESSWFEFYEKNNGEKIIPLRDSQFYIEDFIGLRELDESGRLNMIELDGDHVKISFPDIEKYIVPVFK